MSDKSPLFVSALELLAHATDLYASGHSKKYKFTILHLANSIELILKDCLIDHGITIYKNPKETITIWGTFEELDKLKIAIPEKPVIELLIDDRNTIQHRFGFPNAESVFYYLEQVVAFFVRFLEEQYKVKLSEALEPHLSNENLALIGLVKDDYSHLRRLFQLSPEAAVQQAYTAVEVRLRDLVPASEIRARGDNQRKGSFVPLISLRDHMRVLADEGHISPALMKEFEELRFARNRAAHMSSTETEGVDWDDALQKAIKILGVLDKVKRSKESGEGSKAKKSSRKRKSVG
jgi:hypothetical protein